MKLNYKRELVSKPALLVVLLFCLLSCREKLYNDEVDRNKFCSYFSIRPGSYFLNGETRKTASAQINKIANDKVSSFIQSHSRRFEYIINKIFSTLLKEDKGFDSAYLNDRFCKAISTDSFYYHFAGLTSGDRKKDEKMLSFNPAELMKVASRFFMCDAVREKDTAISVHICIGLNGIPELDVARDYIVLEAFCFEAIFNNLGKKTAFIKNLNSYIAKASAESKKNFPGFQNHLTVVKNKCYALMEKDKDLQNELMSYYRKNMDNINFKIE
jgi:hypothetical protein